MNWKAIVTILVLFLIGTFRFLSRPGVGTRLIMLKLGINQVKAYLDKLPDSEQKARSAKILFEVNKTVCKR